MKNQIALIKVYLKKRKEVLFAFLFGSRQKGLEREISDYDIGVYLKGKDIEKIRNEIWGDLEKILKKEVDLILLNTAPAFLTSEIVSRGRPLIIKNRKVYLDYLIKVTEEAESFREFINDYYQIFQRATSLSKVDQARLKRIIMFLESELRDFPKFEKLTFDEYQKDVSKKREVERWVENLINSTLDISKIILAGFKKPLPGTYREIILELKTIPQFENEICERLSNWVKLRNILAHEYLDIRWKWINEFLKESKNYLKKFLNSAKKLLNDLR